MEQKIAELTEKLFKEGVEKGEDKKKSIIEAAEKEAAAIKDNAKKEAEKILSEAFVKAEEMKRNAESEIKLSSQQAISALKQNIVDIIMAKTLDTNISSTLANPDVLKDLISTIVSNWKKDGQEIQSLEVLLPEKNREILEKSLEGSMRNVLNDGFTLNFSRNIKSGFQIGPENGTFKVSLTDEDFKEFFKDFLRPKTRSFLFEE
ncbi:MAG: V-type ATP synthase subunit E family protein [Chitinispirillia bacterium]|jgi:V/A-type H+-transporting ATPase subunit E